VGSHPNVRTILVGVDDSEASRRVVSFVNSFFGGLDVKVIGMNVGALPITFLPGGAGEGAAFAWPAATVVADATGAVDVEPQLAAAAETVESSGLVEDEVVTAVGDPAARLCKAAVEHGADLIVVGDSHKGAFRRLLEGSVERQVQRDAPCPVLVVP
jgi:nucleotide-binding universal stress UspA family protein